MKHGIEKRPATRGENHDEGSPEEVASRAEIEFQALRGVGYGHAMQRWFGDFGARFALDRRASRFGCRLAFQMTNSPASRGREPEPPAIALVRKTGSSNSSE